MQLKTRYDRIVTALLIAIVGSFFFKAVLNLPLTGLIFVALVPTSMRLLGFPLFEIKDDKSTKV